MVKILEQDSSRIRNPQSAIRNSPVPFVDLKAQYQSIKTEVDAAIAGVIDRTTFIMGPEVSAFEAAFAEYVDAGFCIAVNSGTAAIQLALMASDISAGDEVIVPSYSFFATAEAVSVIGARPIFVDIDPVSYTIDVAAIEKAITPRTRAIIPVHLYGQAADMDPILALAERHNLHVIEDAAQAHGAKYKNKPVGALGQAGCFSFYPSKNLGAYGEGGGIVTNDEELAQRLRLLRDHGSRQKYLHDVVGYNFRMEEIQAAVLNVKLPHLNDWNNLRRSRASVYGELLSGSELVLPREMDYTHHVYHVYAIQTEGRDELQTQLSKAGIQTGIHYPVPIHLQPAYASLGYQSGDLPVTEELCRRVLSLPMFPELSDEQIQSVADVIQQRSS